MTAGSDQVTQKRIMKFSWDAISLVTFILAKRDFGILNRSSVNDEDNLDPNRSLEVKGTVHGSDTTMRVNWSHKQRN